MPLSGQLETMPPTDILQWAATGHKTGLLVVEGPRFTKRVLFQKGLVSALISDDPAEQLGAYLVGWRYLDGEALQQLLEEQRKLGTMLGEELVRRGVLNREELRRVLVVKTEESMFDLLTWREGEFSFLEEARPRREFEGLGVSVDHFLLEGIRQEEERKQFAAVIPDSTHVPSLARQPAADPGTDDVRRIFEAVDGLRSIREVARACRLPEFDVLSALFEAISEGFVTLAPGSDQTLTPATGPTWRKALQEAANSLALGELRQAHRNLRRVSTTPSTDPLALREAQVLEAEIRAEVELIFLEGAPVAVLAVTLQELDDMNTSPEEAFALSRVNSRYTVHEVLSQLPGDRLDNLLVLHDLLLRGLIRLKR